MAEAHSKTITTGWLTSAIEATLVSLIDQAAEEATSNMGPYTPRQEEMMMREPSHTDGDALFRNQYGGEPFPINCNKSNGTVTETNYAEITQELLEKPLAYREMAIKTDLGLQGKLKFDIKSMLKETFSKNPVADFAEDLKGMKNLKGFAFVSTASRLVGIAQALDSVDTLIKDFNDDGKVSMVNVVDATVSTGVLFVKSYVVGLVICSGWVFIQAEFIEPEKPKPRFECSNQPKSVLRPK